MRNKDQKGFTLIELLASVIVLVAVGSVIAGIISSSLRGANKTNTIENIRQNGNYALRQMAKDIEYTLPFDGKNTGLRDSDDADTPYATSCPYSSDSPPVPVDTTYKFITVKSINSVVTEYKCDGSILTANNTSLIDSGSLSLTSCSLTCTQAKITDVPIIGISFTLEPENSSVLAENSSPPITFETSVTMRNYKR